MNRTVPVCLLMLLVAAAIPKTTKAGELRLGVQGGINSANISVTNAEPWNAYSAYTRPVFGAMAELRIAPSLSIAVEPSFVGKGSRLAEHGYHTTDFQFDYIEVPLYTKYRLMIGKVQPYLGAGPSLGFRLRAKSNDEDMKDDIKSMDASVAFGGGFEFGSRNATLFLDGRYAVGLTNIDDSKEDAGELEARNRGLQLRVGVTFRLGGR